MFDIIVWDTKILLTNAPLAGFQVDVEKRAIFEFTTHNNDFLRNWPDKEMPLHVTWMLLSKKDPQD